MKKLFFLVPVLILLLIKMLTKGTLPKIRNLSSDIMLRPGKSGGTWEPSSKKLFGLQENIQPKSRTFVENQVLCRESRTIRIMKESCSKNLS